MISYITIVHGYSETRLAQIINDTVTFASNTKKLAGKSREEFVKEQGEKVFREQTSDQKDRAPRNTKELAVEILRKDHGKGNEFGIAQMDQIRRGTKTVDYAVIWKDVVRTKFTEMWNTALKDVERQKSKGATKVKGKIAGKKDDDVFDVAESSTSRPGTTAYDSTESSSAAGSSAVVEEDPKDLRTCSATLNQILRPDLKSETVQKIRETIEKKQEAVTDHITQISIMAHKVTLEVSCE